MVSITDYNAKKAKGLASIAKVGNAYAVAFKKFSPEDGTSLPDEVQGFNPEDLKTLRAELQEKISDVDSLIADCEAVK